MELRKRFKQWNVAVEGSRIWKGWVKKDDGWCRGMIVLGRVGVLFAPLCAFLARPMFTLGMRNSRAPHALHSPAFLWSACATWESVGKAEAWGPKNAHMEITIWWKENGKERRKKRIVNETGEGSALFGMGKEGWSEILEKIEKSQRTKWAVKADWN